MNAWLIGGGIYVAALLFAMALCRVAALVEEPELQVDTCSAKPNHNRAEYEELVDLDTELVSVAVHQETEDDLPNESPDSRPGTRSHRSSELQTADCRPQ